MNGVDTSEAGSQGAVIALTVRITETDKDTEAVTDADAMSEVESKAASAKATPVTDDNTRKVVRCYIRDDSVESQLVDLILSNWLILRWLSWQASQEYLYFFAGSSHIAQRDVYLGQMTSEQRNSAYEQACNRIDRALKRENAGLLRASIQFLFHLILRTLVIIAVTAVVGSGLICSIALVGLCSADALLWLLGGAGRVDVDPMLVAVSGATGGLYAGVIGGSCLFFGVEARISGAFGFPHGFGLQLSYIHGWFLWTATALCLTTLGVPIGLIIAHPCPFLVNNVTTAFALHLLGSPIVLSLLCQLVDFIHRRRFPHRDVTKGHDPKSVLEIV